MKIELDAKMRKEDLFKKNQLLGIEFDRYLLEHPEISGEVPENAEIFFSQRMIQNYLKRILR